MRYAHIALLLAAAACSMAIATPAPAQAASTDASAYSHRAAESKMDELQPTPGDLNKIDKDNRELNVPASHDQITGAGPVPAEEDALTNRIDQDDPRLDTEIGDICPTCGGAEDAPVHERWSPIYNGFNHQPTEKELRALHLQDVTRDQAQETDRLYDQLMSTP
jgi:hypothetical protein